MLNHVPEVGNMIEFFVSCSMENNVAIVTWNDAHTTTGWMARLIPRKKFEVITSGFVVHEDPENITVAQSIDPNGAYNNTITIPKSVVTGVEYCAR